MSGIGQHSGTRIVVINGSVRQPSRTGLLVGRLAQAIAERVPGEVTRIDIAHHGKAIFSGLARSDLNSQGRDLLTVVEGADILVVGSPVYRVSYTGALKHLFDLIDNRALVGKVAVIAATGGSPLHGLVTEFALRPLLGYFGLLICPTSVYAAEGDFDDFTLINGGIQARIERAADEAAALASVRGAVRVAPLANIA